MFWMRGLSVGGTSAAFSSANQYVEFSRIVGTFAAPPGSSSGGVGGRVNVPVTVPIPGG